MGGVFIEEGFDEKTIDLVQFDTDPAGDDKPPAIRRVYWASGCGRWDDLLRRPDRQ
jgi:hypothetical protein